MTTTSHPDYAPTWAEADAEYCADPQHDSDSVAPDVDEAGQPAPAGRTIGHGDSPAAVVAARAAREAVEARAAQVAGLRALADFLEDNPDAPVRPAYSTSEWSVHVDSADAVAVAAQVMGRADRIETTAYLSHVKVSRWFGPVEYKVIHIPQSSMDRFHAEQSYVPNLRAE